MKRPNTTFEHGASLPTAFFAISLLALTTGLTATLLYERSFTLRVTTHSIEQSLHAAQALLSLLPSAPLPRERRACLSAPTPNNTTPLRLCSIQQVNPVRPLPALIDGRTLRRRDEFPMLDLPLLFREFSACQTRTRPLGPATGSGYRLTPSAVESADVCTIQGQTSDSIRSPANIEIRGPFTITGTAPIVIAAQGYIEFSNALVLASPVFVIAGGDLHIASLTQSGGAPSSATLISLTGSTVVDQVIGDIHLRAIGWEGVYIPSNLRLNSSIAPPPYKHQEIEGLRWESP